jgi:hypothetical protein
VNIDAPYRGRENFRGMGGGGYCFRNKRLTLVCCNREEIKTEGEKANVMRNISPRISAQNIELSGT